MKSDEQLAEDFFATRSYVGPIEDWRNLPDLGEEDDRELTVLSEDAVLSLEQLVAIRERLPGWTIKRSGLSKRFEFGNRRETATFIVQLMADANAYNHHPDLQTGVDCVDVLFTTHSVGDRVTLLDVDSAARAEGLASGLRAAGGPGSGNFGHAGRPGEVGGSSSEGGTGVEESRAIPKLEVIQRVHDLKAQGWSDSRIGREVFNQRGPGRTQEILQTFNRDGTLKEGKTWPPPKAGPPERPAPPVGERPTSPPTPPISEPPPSKVGELFTPRDFGPPITNGNQTIHFGPERKEGVFQGSTSVNTYVTYGRSEASLTPVQAQNARAATLEVDRVLHEYPGTSAHIADMSFQPDRTLGGYDSDHSNAMGLWYGSYSRMIVATGESGDYARTRGREWNAVRGTLGVTRHELGHAVWDSHPTVRIGFRALALKAGGGTEQKSRQYNPYSRGWRARQKVETSDPVMRRGLTSLGKSVSEYSKTNIKELWAESFGLYTHKDYESGKFPKLPPEIDAFMREHIGVPKRAS